jgi:hypothetical protein
LALRVGPRGRCADGMAARGGLATTCFRRLS